MTFAPFWGTLTTSAMPSVIVALVALSEVCKSRQGCRGRSENRCSGATAVAVRDAHARRFACHGESRVSTVSGIFICLFTVPSASGRAIAEQIAPVLSGLPDIRCFLALNIILGHSVTSARQLSQRDDSCFDNCHAGTTAVLIL
jgi:hypothetical protein